MLKRMETNELKINPFELIGEEWMLLTAGNQEAHNTMTVSWGGVGVLWQKNVVYAFVRPQRYTMEFLEKEDYFSLATFPKEYKPALRLCGAKSGRELNKDKATGLTVSFEEPAPYYKESNMVFICKKLYKQRLNPDCFLSKSIEAEFYPQKDHHYVFVGEIVTTLKRD